MNKKYTFEQLKNLHNNGAVIKRNIVLDTKGLNTRGLLVRFGLTINGEHYQAIYSSAGYGNTITSDIMYYNTPSDNFKGKHYKYLDKAINDFEKSFTQFF